ncbi:glycosyltransferase family 2 protein [Desulfovibrio sp. OttesenSCG-928-C14]|nr:glycosyltransferase family 2 protein [Desulfovibrio sp. OttesenSCG-928-C14]
MPEPLFSVIIPIYNKWELTRACLESLCDHNCGLDFEVIVADNASTDASATELLPLGESLFGKNRFKALRFAQNRNFGPACNAGAGQATAPLLFFLNNDTLLTENWAPPLLEALGRDPSLGAVGPLLLYADNTVQHLGITYSSGSVCHLYSSFPEAHPLVRKKRPLQAITAAAMLLPREIFFRAGGFFEGYRNGFEDVDLCLQIGKLGKKPACIPQSRVYHLEGQSQGRGDNEQHNSRLLTERCYDLFRPDLHRHALRDGFKVVLDDYTNESAVTTDELDRELRRGAEGKTLDYLLERINEHPYWLQGHLLLADSLRVNGMAGEAAYYFSKAFNICATEDTARKLVDAAQNSGNMELQNQASAQLERLQTFKRDQESRTALLRKKIRWAEKFQDQFLQKMFTGELEKIKSGH